MPKARRADQGNGQANGKVYHVGRKERAHDPKAAKDAIGPSILMPMKMKK